MSLEESPIDGAYPQSGLQSLWPFCPMAWVAGIAVTAAVLFTSWSVEHNATQRFQEQLRANTVRDLAAVRGS